MKMLIALTILMGVHTSQAASLAVSRTDSQSIATAAYLSGETSKRTLIVKPFSVEQFFETYGALGSFVTVPSMGRAGFFRLNSVPNQNSAALLLETMSQDLNLEYAYFNPQSHNAVWAKPAPKAEERADEVTPDLESGQNYLEASPKGVGAKAAWKVQGGSGENVKIVDIEVCWELDHEDFSPTHYMGANPTCEGKDHGTAVWGEIAAKRDGKGVTGIAYGAKFGVHGFIEGEWDDVNDQYISSINSAIQGAMDHLAPGDVLVIEQQMVGPDAKKYTAVEYWPHIYEQLKAATDRGIICVEAAGNGNSNFDSAAYNGAFDLTKRDSGCIMVGAGDSTSYERLSFSNYGSRVDAFGFGRGVTSTGYGDAFNGGKTRIYTSRFSGTSSATPIVSGAVAVVSSIAKSSGRLLAPKTVRQMLRETGVKQGPSTSKERIGNLPNIVEMIKTYKIPTRKQRQRQNS